MNKKQKTTRSTEEICDGIIKKLTEFGKTMDEIIKILNKANKREKRINKIVGIGCIVIWGIFIVFLFI